MNRINKLFQHKSNNLLSLYFTAGFPERDSTIDIIRAIEQSGADLIEIGIPFSDPLADGPVIQQSNDTALQNDMTIALLFEQLREVRSITDMPIVLMGYFNPIFKYGVAAFCKVANSCGIDGIIIPDMPIQEYAQHYQAIFEQYHLSMIFLITPSTDTQRIRTIDAASNGFIYLVTSAGVTGRQLQFSVPHIQFLEQIAMLKLNNPVLAGFGISDKEGFDTVCKYVNGAIIGSAFINAIKGTGLLTNNIQQFVQKILQ